MIYDIIIIGAGLAGLSAARWLSKNAPDIKFKIVEARDRVGGRTLSQTISLSDPMGNEKNCLTSTIDFGGQWVCPTQTKVMDLLKEFGEDVNLIEQIWSKNKCIIGQPGLLAVLGMAPLTKDEEEEVIYWGKRFNEMSEYLPSVQEPFKYEMAHEWDQITLGDFLKENVKHNNSLKELRLDVIAITGCESDHMSLLYWLMLVRSVPGGYKALDDGALGAQHYTIAKGAQSLSLIMAEKLKEQYGPDIIEYSQPINSIAYENSVLIINEKYMAHRLLLAFSPTLLPLIKFEPKLPSIYHKLSSQMIPGQCIKTIFIYSTAFWRENQDGTIPYLSEETALSGPCLNIYEVDLHDNQYHALIGLIVGDLTRKWSKLPENDLINSVTQQYQRLFNSSCTPIKTCIYYWPNEVFGGGCCLASFPPNLLKECLHIMRQPICMGEDLQKSYIWMACSEMALNWIGYMTGALEAGETSIKEIIQSLA